MKTLDIDLLLEELLKLPKENEWAEFKHNYHSPDEIGERISALSNGACLNEQSNGYLVLRTQLKKWWEQPSTRTEKKSKDKN